MAIQRSDLTDDEPIWLTTAEVARLLSCAPQTVRELVKSGTLPGVRVGDKIIRIPRHSFEQWVAQQEAAAPGAKYGAKARIG